jgi:hypothetical protein
VTEVEAWLNRCDAASRAAIDLLREIAREAGPGLVETIKWNAPSFAQCGKDRITLGVGRNGSVRVVLHRGAAVVKDDFAFNDIHKLAQWPSPDRGILSFANIDEIALKRSAIVDMFARWLAATA